MTESDDSTGIPQAASEQTFFHAACIHVGEVTSYDGNDHEFMNHEDQKTKTHAPQHINRAPDPPIHAKYQYKLLRTVPPWTPCTDCLASLLQSISTQLDPAETLVTVSGTYTDMDLLARLCERQRGFDLAFSTRRQLQDPGC